MDYRSKQNKRRADSVLTEWDASIAPDLYTKLASLHDRRAFILGLLKSATVINTLPLWSVLQGCDRQAGNQHLLQQEPWPGFAAVQAQLFPADGNGPSADDVHATLYLKFVLEAVDTDKDDKKFILDGIKWLNDLTDELFGKPFTALNYTEQDKALKKIAGSNAGERWLSHILLYIMEALLTDPVYGGNPQGIGWQWLAHQPGFPQPSKDKRYTELL